MASPRKPPKSRRRKRQPYSAYLQSAHWLRTKAKALEYYGNSCCFCGSKERLEVHHRSYKRKGRELMSDLTVLCRRCHARHHGKRV